MEERPLQTLKSMLTSRGIKSETFETVGNPLDETRMYTFGGVLIIFSEKTRVTTTELTNFITFASENNHTGGVIVITPTKPSEKVLEMVREYISVPENQLLQIFYLSHLNIDIQKHRYVPSHRILTEEEKTKLAEEYHISDLKKILRIDSQDAMAKWIGARPGDVIEIKGLDVASGEGTRYRYCFANVYEV